jgi:hypothetical protein
MNSTTLLEMLLFNIISDCSDKLLDDAIPKIREYESKKKESMAQIRKSPYISNVIAMLENEYRYRNDSLV